jgi:hypothetical protein
MPRSRRPPRRRTPSPRAGDVSALNTRDALARAVDTYESAAALSKAALDEAISSNDPASSKNAAAEDLTRRPVEPRGRQGQARGGVGGARGGGDRFIDRYVDRGDVSTRVSNVRRGVPALRLSSRGRPRGFADGLGRRVRVARADPRGQGASSQYEQPGSRDVGRGGRG